MSDLISRSDAIGAVKEERFPIDSDYAEGFMAALDKVEWILKEWLPSTQPKPHTNGSITCIKAEKTHDRTTGGCISRRAVEHLDWFTKLYCRDKSITDDLAFRCKQCEFAMPDGICLVKTMAIKLCPDYKDFGAMGDL